MEALINRYGRPCAMWSASPWRCAFSATKRAEVAWKHFVSAGRRQARSFGNALSPCARVQLFLGKRAPMLQRPPYAQTPRLGHRSGRRWHRPGTGLLRRELEKVAPRPPSNGGDRRNLILYYPPVGRGEGGGSGSRVYSSYVPPAS